MLSRGHKDHSLKAQTPGLHARSLSGNAEFKVTAGGRARQIQGHHHGVGASPALLRSSPPTAEVPPNPGLREGSLGRVMPS